MGLILRGCLKQWQATRKHEAPMPIIRVEGLTAREQRVDGERMILHQQG